MSDMKHLNNLKYRHKTIDDFLKKGVLKMPEDIDFYCELLTNMVETESQIPGTQMFKIRELHKQKKS